jgi:copper homeostasis protein
MPGSGIRAGNAQLFKKAGFRALHLSAAALVPNIPPVAGLSMNTPSLLSDSAIAVSQEAAIRKVVESVK